MGTALDLQQARELHTLVLGSDGAAYDGAWSQGLEWNPSAALRYGLWQVGIIIGSRCLGSGAHGDPIL